MTREQWHNQLDYIISLLGYSVGAGSLIKFPFYCMRNGGGAFLIVYIIFTLVGAIPIVFLEMTIGQYSQSGAINVWNMCPLFKGIGVGCAIVGWFFCSYYNIGFVWFMYYFYNSFFDKLPWDNCDNAWNTPTCISNRIYFKNATGAHSNITDQVNASGLTAAEEFWKINVLGATDGLENLGSIRWHLAGCLAVTYVILFLWIFQGIKVSGKLVYVTVFIPFILVTVFLIRGCLLPGSFEGMHYYIFPKFEKLTDPYMWVQSCSFSLYTMGIGMGCIITMSGHNRMENNCFRDAILICLMDCFASIFIGFAFFACVGHVAYLRGVNVEAFESSGYNLAFIVYPDVLASLPFPQLWSVLTFVTMMTLAIDSMVPSIELIVAAVEDLLPHLTRRHWLRNAAVILSLMLFSLIYVSQGGIYAVTLVDWYAYFPSVAVFAMLECIVVGWCYGTTRLQEDISSMWGQRIPRFLDISIKFVCPLLLFVVFCYSLYSYRPPKYGDYIYPTWATAVGWLISLASLLPLAVVFIWTIVSRHETKIKQALLLDHG
ncbi:sodium- and chloride-dependent creatine transporter 1-like isoform X2 [Haliotis asinina]|uniref:sodium- and chloride-dependent creatine transporter 1-like isoform X2 n=1 Tax=Haliotis asinina TaxID=109174 RepID=UPI00353226A1